MSVTLAGNGTGAGTGRWTDCLFADEGGAESTSATDCVGDAPGRRDHLRQPCSSGCAVLAQGEGGRTAGGSAGEEEWREEAEEGGRRREEKGESRQSCGC